jgi:membrane-bound metal-dependent hydrolase YbcI (DUF457 family)
MFLGHLAVGLAAGAREPRIRLGTAVLAAQWADALWPVLVLAGVERVAIAPGDTVVTPLRFDHYPWSHSLLALAVWAAAFGAAIHARTRVRSAAMLAGAAVLSHWLLDFASHRADMPIGLAGPKVGLGLWNSLPATVAVEGGLFVAAVAYYARRRAVTRGFWILIATLGAIYAANLAGPPPPSVTAVVVSAVLLVPLLLWWANRVEGLPRRG